MNALRLVPAGFAALAPACPPTEPPQEEGLVLEVLVEDLEVPWGMDFLPDGALLFTERPGRVSIWREGEGAAVLHERTSLDRGEGGLLGLAVDPAFESNGFVYVYETVRAHNRIVRLRMEGDALAEDRVIYDGIPKARFHNGGILRFGPDGYLYAGTGDAGNPSSAPDRSTPAGKILRMDREGNPAPGNPFGTVVWSTGHRNVQGFDWNEDGMMAATEHGPSGEIHGWCCHDELNLIQAGEDYGWPHVIGDDVHPGSRNPASHSGRDTWAPGGGVFLLHDMWGAWEGDFLMACLRGQQLRLFRFRGERVTEEQALFDGELLRLRNTIRAPDGAVIFCSSNRDGRAPAPRPRDDKIRRLRPAGGD